jgi:phospholipid/cholesterol/gamma-HCH transport system substrate-binding protein
VNRRTEIQVGLTVLVALVVLLLGVTWLKDFSLQRHVSVWHVRFPQAGGLGPGDEVLVNGIRKGAVATVALAGDHVTVDLSLSSDVQPTRDSHIGIRNVGLMGEKVIAMDLRTTGAAYAPADTIVGQYEEGLPEVLASLGGTTQALDHLAAQLDGVATRLNDSGDLEATVKSFRAASEQLQAAVVENRALLHETLENARAASATAKALTTGREAQFGRTLDAVERAAQNMERLSARLDSLRAQLQVVAARVDHGDGTLAQLVNDRKLYDDVRASVNSLNSLIADIKLHPKKYINLRIF